MLARYALSALMLLVGQQWGAGVVICLKRDAFTVVSYHNLLFLQLQNKFNDGVYHIKALGDCVSLVQ